MVIRETSGLAVGPTARLSMLKPRRLKRPAMRARTPGLFSTRTDKVCLLMFSSPSEVVLVELRREVAGILDFVVAGASGDHRPDHGVAVDRKSTRLNSSH